MKNILRWGLFVLPVLALIIAGGVYGKILLPGMGDTFFPFITGKNFFFRIFVEILLVLWVFAMARDKSLRPKASPVLWAVLATLAVLTLATFFGENPYRSFWSNYERMEGLIGHLHLFAYFLILVSVFKIKTDWIKFLWANVAVSFLISSYAYLQLFGAIRTYQSGERLDATLGNSTYLAIYIVFHLFILLYLFLTAESRSKWVKYSAGAIFLFELPIVFFTATRGAILGLLGGMLLFGILYGFFGGSGKGRKLSLALIGAVLLIVGGFWLVKDSDFARDNYVLERFATLSLTEQTTTSRLTIWGMSWEGVGEHPVLGWGPENYVLLFNKYYRPEMWKQEPWFDRAHNIVFDWLVSAGILGFLAYVSIFLTALYVLWTQVVRSSASNTEVSSFKIQDSRTTAAVFTSLFAAYFFNNLFVFDNLTSYFLFFLVLGFIHFQYFENNDTKVVKQNANAANYANLVKYIAPALAAIVLPFVIYFVNVKPIMASRALVGALGVMNANYADTDAVVGKFEEVFSLNTFGSGEAREQFALYANNIAFNDSVPQEKKSAVLSRAIEEMELQVESSPKDARGYMFLAPLYVAAGNVAKANEIAKGALEVAPNKQQILFVVTDVYLSTNQPQKAYETVKKAYELDPSYHTALINFAIIAVATGHPQEAEEALQAQIGKKVAPDPRLANAYGRIGRFDRVRDVWLALIEQKPNDSQYRVNLAATYLTLGERQKAIESIEEAVRLNPSFAEQGQFFIDEIKAGRNP